MNLLMTIAVIGAAVIGQWSEAAAVTFLFGLSELLESFSVARARRAIQSLMKLAPETAWLKTDEAFSEVPVAQVTAESIITVKSGARVPLDGAVIAGTSTVNQAPITGESMPVEKKAGDTVFAGTINGEGSLEVRVTKAYADTTLARNGRGAEAELDGHHYFVGNHRFTHELAVCSEDIERKLAEIEAQAQSVVVIGHKPHGDCKGEVLGVLAVGDAIRPNAAEAVRSLHAAGILQVVMLSGDNQRTVDAIAHQVGIDEARGDLLPEQKVDRVRELMARHKHVGMIGDGVNDAPAMAVASVGIAMGAAGTDTAIEIADMALLQDDLSKVAGAIRLGRRTVRVIQANIAFALGVKAIFLALALTGHTSLWLAILADTGATLVVIANALRLLRR